MTSSSEALYTRQIRRYLEALERGDVDAICALFEPDARILSPFLGWMMPAPFFAKVAEASGQSTITPIGRKALYDGLFGRPRSQSTRRSRSIAV